MDDIVENILKERYYQPGETCWDDIARRVSDALFDKQYEQEDHELCKKYLNEKKFIFNSPTLMNAGTELGQLSACFTLPIKDDMSDIYDTIRKSALIFQSGGGVGINWSTLRPEGALVKSSNGTASGPLAFMHSFDAMVETVKSAGKRRGAAIAVLNDNHPDILKFITSKNEEGKLSNFNISVLLTDEFMKCVEANTTWNLTFDGKLYQQINARDMFNTICEAAWIRAEPGVLFYDTINKDNPMKHEFGDIITVNPCGEQPLCVDYITGGGEACVLGSIDISKFIIEEGHFSGCYNSVDLEDTIRFAVRALDRIVDANKYPLPEIKDCVMKGRKIGLGVMGWADALIKMKIPYGSNESIDLANEIMEFIRRIADDESINIGNGKKKNACTLTCAPSGTISIFGECSSGIEPNFGWVYNRSTWVDGEKKTYRMVHPLFEKMFGKYTNYMSILDHVEKYGTLKECPSITQKDIDLFCVAKDISPFDHVKMQAAFQKYIDAAVSKTINCPKSTTVQDIYNIYMEAWKSGCKGLTIYRDGSRNDVVLETKTGDQKDIVDPNPVVEALKHKNGRILPKTPRSMPGCFEKRQSGCGKLYVAIGESDGRPHSIIIENSDSGGCTSSQKAIARLVALAFRWKIPLFDVVNALNVKCDVALKNKKADGKSCAAIVGNIIKENYPVDDAPPKTDYDDDDCDHKSHVDTLKIQPLQVSVMICPDCGEALIFESGCVICKNCGYSKCS